MAEASLSAAADGKRSKKGALILSAFAEALKELLEALRVNPYDIKGMAEAMHQALIMRGKMVWEIVYPGYHKGSAIEYFMEHKPFAGRRPVFLGDDETDAFAMQACVNLGGMATQVGPYEGHVFSTPGVARQWIGEQCQ